VLITRFLGSSGVSEVEDFMPIHRSPQARRSLIRRIVAVRGEMRLRVDCQPRFDYGRGRHTVELTAEGAVFRSAGLTLALATEVPLERHGDGVSAEMRLSAGESATFSLEELGPGESPRALSDEQAVELYHRTVRYWRGWLSHSRYSGRWRGMVHRSALTLKLLTYRPTGAIVAAPTTSLPEQPGGERNWDCRYTWIRDAAFSLYGLLRLGFMEEAEAFMAWLADRYRTSDGDDSGPLQIMYAIDGRADLTEERLDHLEGYRGSRPVRVGNAAADQLQLDIYGELIDSVYLFNKYGRPIYHDDWQALTRIVEWVCQHRDQPDEGIWEVRGGRKDFTFSRLMPGSRWSGRSASHDSAGFPAISSTGSRDATRSTARSWIGAGT
jgi:GH15 family glucan-1,4-alpha-glucosidase